jgi:hypothetical protein
VAVLATTSVLVAFVVATGSALVVQGGSMWFIRRFGW